MRPRTMLAWLPAAEPPAKAQEVLIAYTTGELSTAYWHAESGYEPGFYPPQGGDSPLTNVAFWTALDEPTDIPPYVDQAFWDQAFLALLRHEQGDRDGAVFVEDAARMADMAEDLRAHRARGL